MRLGRKTILPDLVSGDLNKLTSRTIFDAAEAGDELAITIFEETGCYIGRVIASLSNILDPKLVIIGGQVAQAGDILFHSIQRQVERDAPIGRMPKIVPAILGNDAGVLGAAAMTLEGEGILKPGRPTQYDLHK